MGWTKLTTISRPNKEHTEIEESLHDKAHIDYDRVAIVCLPSGSRNTPVHMPELTVVVQIPNPSVAALYEDALVSIHSPDGRWCIAFCGPC